MTSHSRSGVVAVNDKIMAFWFAAYGLNNGGIKTLGSTIA
jgi:hypothetical protein